MKRFSFGIDMLSESPLLGIYLQQCEVQFFKNWHPATIISFGFLFFTISFTYLHSKS
tara:strand:+ start:599 stop:769 length:171 start_codon:yes stop_codon:yes gene_type:complete